MIGGMIRLKFIGLRGQIDRMGLLAEKCLIFARRRLITDRLIGAQTLVKTAPISGAMYAMLDIRATGLSGIEFANQLLDTHQIATMPGESFGAAAAGHIRIAMTVDDATFATALTKICDAAERWTKTRKMT